MTPRLSESQRDSSLQPRVGEVRGRTGRASPPWVTGRIGPLPQRGCGHPITGGHNSVGVGTVLGSFTQGSRSAPTLGWRPLPRWGRTPLAEIITIYEPDPNEWNEHRKRR